eukprot:4395945-Amphidinium_carterae.1
MPWALCPGMQWLAMDARALKFDDGSFDVVFEKGRAMLGARSTASKAPPVLAEGLLQKWTVCSLVPVRGDTSVEKGWHLGVSLFFKDENARLVCCCSRQRGRRSELRDCIGIA